MITEKEYKVDKKINIMKVRKEGNKGEHYAEKREDGKCIMLLRLWQ